MTCVLPNSKTLTAPIQYQGQWIHFVRGSGGHESSRKQLGGFEQYLSGDDVAPRPAPGKKGGAQKRDGWA